MDFVLTTQKVGVKVSLHKAIITSLHKEESVRTHHSFKVHRLAHTA